MRVLETKEQEGYTYLHFIANKAEYSSVLELKRQYEAMANKTSLVENYDGTHLLTVEKITI